MVLGWLYGKREDNLASKTIEFHQELGDAILKIENAKKGDKSRDGTKPDLCLILIAPQNKGKNRHLFHHTSKTIKDAIIEWTKNKYDIYQLGEEKVGLIVPVKNNGINSGAIFSYGARLKEMIEADTGINVCIGISAYPTNAKSRDKLIELAEDALNGAKYTPNKIFIP